MSNLTVSYSSQTPAVTPAGPKAAAPAADSPLGFLASLLDQLAGTDPSTSSTGETGATIDIAGLLDASLTNRTTASSSETTDLVAALNAQLDKLQNGGDAGALGDAIDALGTGGTAAASSADITALRDRLAALSQSLAATNPGLANKLQALNAKLDPAAADPDALTIANLIRSLLGKKPAADDADASKASAAAPQVADNLLQVLTTLGLNTPPVESKAPTSVDTASVSASAGVTGSAAVPADLLRLSSQLSQVATELAGKSPDLAKKIEAVATRLVSGDASNDLLARLTDAAAQSDGTALDKLVRNLIEAKPVTAPAPAVPQIAAATLPAPVAPKQSKFAAIEVKAAPPDADSVTPDSAPKSAQNVAAAVQEPASDPKPEAKAEAKAAALVSDAPKSDAAAQQAQAQPQQAPAVVQPVRALPAAYQTAANPINMGQMAFEMMRQIHQGSSRFTIRLDPPEMGRVDVKMHVDATGAVNARLTVDRAETLDLFQRDRQSLERALAQAGLEGSKTNLEFSLRQQNNPFAGMMGGDGRQQQPGFGGTSRVANSDEAAVPAVTLYRGTASAGGINIFA